MDFLLNLQNMFLLLLNVYKRSIIFMSVNATKLWFFQIDQFFIHSLQFCTRVSYLLRVDSNRQMSSHQTCSLCKVTYYIKPVSPKKANFIHFYPLSHSTIALGNSSISQIFKILQLLWKSLRLFPLRSDDSILNILCIAANPTRISFFEIVHFSIHSLQFLRVFLNSSGLTLIVKHLPINLVAYSKLHTRFSLLP